MKFDDWKCRASGLGLIMPDPIGKNNQEKYNDALKDYNSQNEIIEKFQSDLDAMTVGTKAYESKMNSYGNAVEKFKLICDKFRDAKDVRYKVFLSETAKTNLMKMYVSDKYGRTFDIKMKYMEKGTMLQEAATTIYSRIKKQYFKTNKEQRENDFVKGEMDFDWDERGIITDVKVSWNIYTFFANIGKPINPIYDWQLQAYMWLWNCEEARLAYILLDTPDKFIEDEKKHLLYEFVGTEEQYMEACLEIEHKMKYPDIPMEERVIEFVVKRDEEKISRIPAKIEACREYLNNIKDINYIIET